MRTVVAAVIVLGICFAAAGLSVGAEPAAAGALTPVKTFASKDLPEPEPGKPAWRPGNQWSYGIVAHDKWVYAASTAEYILQFKRDPSTANIEYLGAVPFGHHDPEKGVGVNRLTIRRLADGNVIWNRGASDAARCLRAFVLVITVSPVYCAAVAAEVAAAVK